MSSNHRTDAELLLESLTAADAFGVLYDRHAADLLAWITHTIGTGDAPDLLAELFAQAWIARKRFKDPGDGSARAWLFGIGKNLIRTYRRKRVVEARGRRRLGMDLSIPTDIENELAARIDAAARRGELNEALEQLPAGQRDAVHLRVVDGLSYPHVAAALECSEVTARQRVSQGLRALRIRLEESR